MPEPTKFKWTKNHIDRSLLNTNKQLNIKHWSAFPELPIKLCIRQDRFPPIESAALPDAVPDKITPPDPVEVEQIYIAMVLDRINTIISESVIMLKRHGSTLFTLNICDSLLYILTRNKPDKSEMIRLCLVLSIIISALINSKCQVYYPFAKKETVDRLCIYTRVMKRYASLGCQD